MVDNIGSKIIYNAGAFQWHINVILLNESDAY